MPAYRKKTGSNRGTRFQGKGWRDPCGGGLYFQLKRASFSRGHEVFPQTTMSRLIGDLIRKLPFLSPILIEPLYSWPISNKRIGEVKQDYPALDEGLEFAFFLRKKVLEPTNERAFDIFDGGETVYVKIVDEEGTEYVQCYGAGEGNWEIKVRGKKPTAADVIARYGVGEAARLGLIRWGDWELGEDWSLGDMEFLAHG